MTRFLSNLTAAIVAASVFGGASFANAKGSHSAPHHSASSNHQNHNSQHKNSSHKDSDHCDKNGCGDKGSGQFYPGGVPFGHGPAGTPSNPGQTKQLSPGQKFAGQASRGFTVDKKGSFDPVPGQKFAARNGRGYTIDKNHSTRTNPHKPGSNGTRATSDWDALGEAVNGLGDALSEDWNDIDNYLTPGFTGPPVNQK
jgi:hypothetical protein